jgi:hypothetical protein
MLRKWLLGALALTFVATAALPVVDTEAARAPTPTRTPTRTPTPVGAGQATQRRAYVPVVSRDPTPTPTPSPTPAPRTAMAVGANVIDNNFELVRDMGFSWVKLYADWDGADPEGQVDAALQRYPGVGILLRIDKAPAAARTGNDADPIRAEALQAYLRNLVVRLKGKVRAYELFNEPNLKWEWNTHIAGGGGMPSAAGYARILQAAYPVIKEIDPSAIVVTGGLSPAGDGGPGSVGDLAFMQGLYDNAGGSFDAIGIHPYGGPFAWDQGRGDPGGVYFLRAEEARGVMLRNGDAGRTLWATEFGWLVDPRAYGYATYQGRDCLAGLGGRINWVRSPQDVAGQLAAAYRYAADNWPWLGGMFFFNFDFSAAGWVSSYDKVCDAPTWYSIVSKGNMPGRPYTEPAYDALKSFTRDYLLAR